MVAKGLYSAMGGAFVGSLIGLGGDYLNHKVPQKDSQGQALKPSDKDYSYFMDRSVLVNGISGVAGLAAAFFLPKKYDMWAVGAGTLGVVTLAKAAMRMFRIYQEKDSTTGNEWANYSRMVSQYYQLPSGVGYHAQAAGHRAYRHEASLPNPVIESQLFNIK